MITSSKATDARLNPGNILKLYRYQPIDFHDIYEEKIEGTPVVVADLDGTVLTVNSWRIFSKRVVIELAHRKKYWKASGLISKMLLKKLRILEHREVKYYFCKEAQKLGNDFINEIVSEIIGYKNQEVLSIIKKLVQKGVKTILATAAAGEYAKLLGKQLGFDYVICTPEAEASIDQYLETRGSQKVEEIRKLIDRENLRVSTVISDHWHDLPLLTSFSRADSYIVNPNRETLRKIKLSGLKILKIT